MYNQDDMKTLLVKTLRLPRNRIIVGRVKDKDVWAKLSKYNQGHSG